MQRYTDKQQISARPVGALFVGLVLFVGMMFLLLGLNNFNMAEFIHIGSSFYLGIMAIGRAILIAALAKTAPQAFGEIAANGAFEIL